MLTESVESLTPTRLTGKQTPFMDKQPGKQERKRKATEQKIIAAVGKILRRDGIQKLGVNAIVKEAGVGKGLIYQYFGGLEGLLDAWVESSHFIPDVEEIAGGAVEEFKGRSMPEQIRDVNINYASYLRRTPLALEIYAEELQQSSAITKSMARVRRQIGTSHEKFFTEITPVSNEDDLALILSCRPLRTIWPCAHAARLFSTVSTCTAMRAGKKSWA